MDTASALAVGIVNLGASSVFVRSRWWEGVGVSTIRIASEDVGGGGDARKLTEVQYYPDGALSGAEKAPLASLPYVRGRMGAFSAMGTTRGANESLLTVLITALAAQLRVCGTQDLEVWSTQSGVRLGTYRVTPEGSLVPNVDYEECRWRASLGRDARTSRVASEWQRLLKSVHEERKRTDAGATLMDSTKEASRRYRAERRGEE